MADLPGATGTVDVTTPDGRRLTLPAQLAGSFPDLQQAPGGGPGPAPPGNTAPALPGGGSPTFGPGDQADLAGATARAPTPVIADLGRPPTPVIADLQGGGPVTSPGQVPSGGPEVAPRRASGPVTVPGEDGGAQPVAPVAPLTSQQLLKEGQAGVLNAENKAIDQQQAAVQRSAQVEADAATREGHIMAARDAQTQQILQERARVAAENQARLDARMNERDAAATKIANTRIDRSIDHPVWAAIGVALGAIGGAMQQKAYGGAFHNQAFDTLMQQIDRKVAAQMEDLDNQRKNLAQMGVGIGEERQRGMDRLGEIDVRRDAAIQQAKQAVETMATQMKTPAALANAQQLNAKLEEVRAQNRGVAAERIQAQQNAEAARAQAAQQHKDSIALQLRGQNLEDSRFYYGKQLEEKEKLAADAVQLLKEGKAESAARLKLASEQGIVDPRTGTLLLTPAGDQKMAQADAAEAAARKASDPARARDLAQHAADLRESARINDAAVGLNKKGAEDAQLYINQAHDMANRIDGVLGKLEAGPSAFDREAWAGLKVYLDGIQRSYAQGGKERLSPLALKSMGDILSIDPNNVFDRVANQGKAIAALKALRSQTAESAVDALRGAGIQSKWEPGRVEERDSLAGKTADEIAADAEPGALPLPSAIPRIPGDTSAQDNAREAATARRGAPTRANPEGVTSNYGLDPATDEAVRGLLKRADGAGNKAYSDIVQRLARPLTATDRPGLDTGVARLIRDEDPRVLPDVLAAVAASAGQMRADELAAQLARPELRQADPLTPGAQRQLDAQKARLREGKPPDVPAVVPLTPAIPETKIPPGLLDGMSPEQRRRYLEHIRANGFSGA